MSNLLRLFFHYSFLQNFPLQSEGGRMCRLSFKGGRTVKRESLHLFLKVYLFFFQSFFPPLDKAHIAQHIWEAPDRNMILKREKGKKKKSWCTDLQEQGLLCVAHSFMAGTSVSSQTSNEKEALTSKASSWQEKKKKPFPLCVSLFVPIYFFPLSQTLLAAPKLISFYRVENTY